MVALAGNVTVLLLLLLLLELRLLVMQVLLLLLSLLVMCPGFFVAVAVKFGRINSFWGLFWRQVLFNMYPDCSYLISASSLHALVAAHLMVCIQSVFYIACVAGLLQPVCSLVCVLRLYGAIEAVDECTSCIPLSNVLDLVFLCLLHILLAMACNSMWACALMLSCNPYGCAKSWLCLVLAW